MVVLSAIGRLGGGWWTDRRPTAGMLMICYGVAAALCLIAASAPRSWWLVAPTITGIAVCDGIASGALLALIGKATRADSAGAVMGVTGAAGAFGALLPPLLLAGLYNVTDSYFAAWALLAAMLLAGAFYVRTHGLYVGLGLAVRFEPEPGPATMTVAFVGEAETRLGGAAVIARLAELATSDELIVVYGADERTPRPRRHNKSGADEIELPGQRSEPPGQRSQLPGENERQPVGEKRPGQRPGLSTQDLAEGLRDRLPRHSVVAIRVTPQAEELGRDALLLGEYLEAGTLAIAATPAVGLRSVAADLSLYLQADRMVRVSYTPAEGAGLQKV